MRVFITGGTGFAGSTLSTRLAEAGNDVVILTRRPDRGREAPRRISFLEGDPRVPGPWQDAVRGCEAVINLAGASLFRRWTKKHRRRIFESRILTTRNLVAALPSRALQSVTLISASAVGFYGLHEDEELDERSPAGDDFLAGICREWEEAALGAQGKDVRVVWTRSGVVLGRGGGMLGTLLPFFRLGLGGPLGRGRQWLSWIHIADWTEAILYILACPEIRGSVNVCSPHPVRNREFTRAIGHALRRPAILPAPAFAIRLVFGEMSQLALKGQRVIPRRLEDAGFVFRFPEIRPALEDILRKKRGT